MANRWQPFASQSLLNEFCALIEQHARISIPFESRYKIERQLQPIVHIYGFKNSHECMKYLMQAPLTQQQIDYIVQTISDKVKVTLSDRVRIDNGCEVEGVQDRLSALQNDKERYAHMDELIQLACGLFYRGELREALKWCEEGIVLDRLNPRLHYLRATILERQGDKENASLSLQSALYLDR